MPQPVLLTLQDADGSLAVIAPELGGWLLRYARPLDGHGLVEALHFSQEVVDRYPLGMYAGNPLLFPLASNNRVGNRENCYEWHGRLHEMPQHGFGRRSKWTVTAHSENAVTMELTDSESTRPNYPFAFRHQFTYRLAAGKLHWEQIVENCSTEPMPFSTGVHPYFQIPLTTRGQRNACFVRVPAAQRLRPVGQFESFEAAPFPAQEFSVREDVTGTFYLGELARPELALVDPLSRLEIVFNWTDAPQHRFVALWSKAGDAPFYCLEPWTAMPNVFTRRADDLLLLPSGKTFRAAMWVELRNLPA